ncbi:MAG: acetate--CoA ligase [Zetaproteobacteria bacterium]|nr:acetate--CoA ligase [Zetaproteobacteria bacterium]
MQNNLVESLLERQQPIPSPQAFQDSATFKDAKMRQRRWEFSLEQSEMFWAHEADRHLQWIQTWDQVFVDHGEHKYSWFAGGKLNVSVNCLDRHLAQHAQKRALIWEGEDGSIRRLTYQELHLLTLQIASGLRALGYGRGDTIAIYMPLIPEAIATMLACTRIGAAHNVIFAGFSAQALATRIEDAGCRLLMTSDVLRRGGKTVSLSTQVAEAIAQAPTLQDVVTLYREAKTVTSAAASRVHQLSFDDLVTQGSTLTDHIEPCDSETPLFLMYTSGSTGKPKGLVHTTAGYLVQVASSFQHVFEPRRHDIFWCTADIGWITSHSYMVYGPLSHAQTIFIYEGAPAIPNWERFWQMVERHGIHTLYTAPTAIRAFMQHGHALPDKYDLSSLRLLGSVGEPINPEAWQWYFKHIGRQRCPIVDTWWQTETGSIMVSTQPGSMAAQPGSAGKPLFGIQTAIVDTVGKPVAPGTGGHLIIERPWPSLARTIQGDHARYKQQYWSQFPGKYHTGDAAVQDEHGYLRILGRTDDVINVSGHRISTMELESAIALNTHIHESAVIGVPHPIKGTCLHIFISLRPDTARDPAKILADLQAQISAQIGRFAQPERTHIWPALPKTRSGKIMRRLLRDYVHGNTTTGDLSTLENLHLLTEYFPDESSQEG